MFSEDQLRVTYKFVIFSCQNPKNACWCSLSASLYIGASRWQTVRNTACGEVMNVCVTEDGNDIHIPPDVRLSLTCLSKGLQLWKITTQTVTRFISSDLQTVSCKYWVTRYLRLLTPTFSSLLCNDMFRLESFINTRSSVSPRNICRFITTS